MEQLIAGKEWGIFLAMVAVAVFFLVYSLAVPAFGPEREAAKRLRKRITKVANDFGETRTRSLLREQYLRNLSPIERLLESLPGAAALQRILSQSGSSMPAYRLVFICLASAIGALLISPTLGIPGLAAIVLALIALVSPVIYFNIKRVQRLNQFDEQLPEALDVITRALRAGHPFNESLRLVREEMDDPIASEFGATFDDINYGADIRSAFMSLIERAPSMSLMSVVVSVLIQRETGGNLAEVLEKTSAIVRSRFRFQRKVRTLSAEGRLSAWILALLPFGLFLMITISTPSYLPILIEDELGRKLIAISFVLSLIGIFWMRRIIRIDV